MHKRVYGNGYFYIYITYFTEIEIKRTTAYR